MNSSSTVLSTQSNTTASASIQISDAELKSLTNVILNRYGLDFTNYETKSLKRGLVRLMMKHKMATILDLWSRILKDRNFFEKSIDDLMVNLTELFRNPDAWLKIKDEVLPHFHSKPIINIWHAGCSTGEEVYTMAIILQESGLIKRVNTMATDLSNSALQKAQKGEYSLIVMKNYLKPFLQFFPNKTMEDFFDYHQFSAIVKPQLTKHINFQRKNLVHDREEKKYDIIFCRNVMIYFDEPLKIKVLELLNDSLNTGGFLVIGYYDTIPDKGRELFDVYDNATRIYKKKSI